ncbi:MAG TPA: ribbon-helix-helix protein, CopG family [Thermoanaerobaculia bacterium]|jgi:hypothetical protein|nr:ribbon-helix-helix protein, CopG family [Thermoanaerobaculia bacterium]
MGRRLTITLDDDVAARLDAAARRAGAPVEEVASDTLRRALPAAEERVEGKPYVFPPFTPLQLKPGIDIDNIEELLDQVEGPTRK